MVYYGFIIHKKLTKPVDGGITYDPMIILYKWFQATATIIIIIIIVKNKFALLFKLL